MSRKIPAVLDHPHVSDSMRDCPDCHQKVRINVSGVLERLMGRDHRTQCPGSEKIRNASSIGRPLLAAVFFCYCGGVKRITIFTDGNSRGNPGPAAIGAQIIDARGTVVREVSETIGNATNNFAEYHAVLRGLQVAVEVFGKSTKDMQVELKLDSDFVKKQLNAEYQIKEPGLVPYFIEIHNMRVSSFPHLAFTHISREFNKEANRLANEAFDR